MRINFFSCVLLSSILVSCANESPKLVPYNKAQVDIQDLGEVIVNYNPKVDILFAIDASGSMKSHQNNLKKNISLFIDEIRANKVLDYNIGVIQNEMMSGQAAQSGILEGVPNIVNKQTSNAKFALEKNLIVGTNGNHTEKFFPAVIQALSKPRITKENKGFLRDNAVLAVIFVADTYDQSDVSVDEMQDFLLDLKLGDVTKIAAYGAIVPTGVNNCARDGNITPVKMEELITRTGGAYFSLCDPDFGKHLADIGDDIRNRVEQFVPLYKRPAVETIEVRFGSQLIPHDKDKGWIYDPQRIGLYFGPELELKEELPGTGVTVKFATIESQK